MKMMILALVIAAAFIVPASFIANSDSADGTEDASLLLAENDDSLESSYLLASNERTEYVLPMNITETIVIPEDKYVVFKNNYVMSENAWIFFEEGSELRFDITEQFSIVARENCGIGMQEGSYITAVYGDYEYETPVEEDTFVGFTGQLDYIVSLVVIPDIKFTMTLRILDTSTVIYEGVSMYFNGDLDFKAEFYIDGDLSTIQEGFDKANFLAEGKLTAECGEIDLEMMGMKGSVTKLAYLYDVTFATPKYLGTDYAELRVVGSDGFNINSVGLSTQIADSATLKIRMTIDDDASLADIDISGTADSQILITDLDATDFIVVKDAAITNTFDFNEGAQLTTFIHIGYLEVPYTIEDENGVLIIQDFDVQSSCVLELNTLAEIFSYQNLVNIYSYLTEHFDAEESGQYIYDYFYPQLIVYYPDSHEMVDDLLNTLIEEMPEESVVPMGAILGYFNYMASEKMINLEMQYKNILSNVEDNDFIQYFIGCQKYMLSVGFGYEVFVPPALELNTVMTIGAVIYTDGYDYARVDGFSCSMEATVINDDVDTCFKIGYEDAFCNMHDFGREVNVSLPAASLTFKSEGLNVDLTVDIEGDYKYENELLERYLHAEDINARLHIAESLGHFGITVVLEVDHVFGKNDVNYIHIDDLIVIDHSSIDIPIDSVNDLFAIYFAIAEHEFPGIPTDPFEVFAIMDDYAKTIADAINCDVKDITCVSTFDLTFDHFGFRMNNEQFGEAVIDGFSGTFNFGIADGENVCLADVRMKSAELDHHSSVISNHMDIENFHAYLKLLADNHMIFDVDGSFVYGDGVTTDIEQVAVLDKVELKMDIYPDAFGTVYEIQHLDGKLKMYDRGVMADFGNVSYNTETGDVKAGNVKISGCDAYHGSTMKSVSGTVYDVTIYFEDGVKFTCTGYDLEMEMHHGSVHMKVNNAKSGEATMDVKGTVSLEDCQRNLLLNDLMYLTGSQVMLIVDVKGDGMLHTSVLTSFVPYTGVLYATEGFVGSEYVLGLDVHHCAFGFEGDKVTLRAYDGYTLDPDSFAGFTIKDGEVIIDPAILEAKSGILSARAYGDAREVTVDGEKYSVTKGTTFELAVGPNVLYMADKHGNQWGIVENGVWYLHYIYDHDLSVTSVVGKTVTPLVDATTYAPVNDIIFWMPLEYNYVEFKLPCGAIVVYEDQDLAGSLVWFSVRERTYDGNAAYEIVSNATMYVYLPIDNTEVTMYHVVNHTGIPVQGSYYVDEDGKLMYLTELTSYSTYYFDSDKKYSDGYVYGASFVIVLILVLVLGGHFVWKSRKSH